MSDELFAIGEVANKLNLPVHTIRYWTKMFDNIEYTMINGRRYFDNLAIEEFKKIKDLEYKKGLSISGIKQMLRYRKIDVNKLDGANRDIIADKVNEAINIINKQILYIDNILLENEANNENT